jgi:cytidylate kinase
MTLHYYPLINKVITTLNLRERLAFIDQHNAELSFTKPFITIAREPGSGGAPIARMVAQKLGFSCVDEEIIDEIARSTKKRKEVIKAIDEKSRSTLQDMVHSLLNTEYVDDLKYVTELVKVVLTYAHQGYVVILGRGANFITPFAQGLHVNVTAPYQVRVERAMKFEGVNEAQAREVIAKTELERKEFVKQYLKKDINKPNSYDLTINTAYLDVEQASALIVDAFYQKFSRLSRYSALFKG